MSTPLLIGCDFSSAPSRRKPIVVAHGTLVSGRVALGPIDTFENLDSWAAWLAQPVTLVAATFSASSKGGIARPRSMTWR